MITKETPDGGATPEGANNDKTPNQPGNGALQQIKPDEEITREQLALGKRLLNWRTLLPLLVVIVALVFFARQARVDPLQTWNAIRSANPGFLLAAFVAYYLSFPVRALRWRMLLRNVGFNKQNGVHLPGLAKLTEIIYISWFANAIVPAKLGDVYRAYLLRQETRLPASRSFGSDFIRT